MGAATNAVQGLRETVALRVRVRRRLLGLNQAQLAARMGGHRSAISLIEAGRRVPSAANLVRLSDALECSADWLLGRGPLR